MNKLEFQPIPAGAYKVISAWLANPTEFLTNNEVQAKTRFSAYIVIPKMLKDGLLEESTTFRDEKARFSYRPTKKGWLEYYDYKNFWNIN